jgi:pimeloyl-ACP methyl ester carboxylesterase
MDHPINVMLVHGAWADGSCWSKVILLLQAKGITVTAAQIPLTSLTDDIAVTKRLLSMKKESTVLVGHSYGGAVITGGAGEVPHVSALVYITAFGLDEGESLQSLSSQGPPSAGSAAIEADSAGYLWINRKKFHQSFVGDATADEAAIMAAVQKPLSIASFTEKEHAPAWKRIPSWYLLCRDNQMIPPPAQEFMAKRMNATANAA